MDIDISNRAYKVLSSLRRSELPLSKISPDVYDQLNDLKLVRLDTVGYKNLEDLPSVPIYNVVITEYGRGYLDGRKRNDSRIRAASTRSWIAIVLSACAIAAQIIAALISAGSI